MTDTSLVVRDLPSEPNEREVALARLGEAADTAATPEEAQAIMLQGRIAADWLTAAREPFEQAWLAGKASVVAARRLGRMLGEVPNDSRPLGGGGGSLPGERTLLTRELGISDDAMRRLVRLGNVDDPDFQRYIQRRDVVPSLGGALVACNIVAARVGRTGGRRMQRRKRAGVSTPKNPSFDEGYSLIVKALGHLGAVSTQRGTRYKLAVSQSMDLLYQAEDLLKPFRGGYGE